MRLLHIVAAGTLATAALALDVKWTPANDEGPLPLSKNYRDKLDELEAKVTNRFDFLDLQTA